MSTPNKPVSISWFQMAKGVTSFVAGAGAGSIAGNAAKSFIPTDTSAVKKVTCIVGAFAISGIAADAASKYTTNYFNDTYSQVMQAKKLWNEGMEERKKDSKKSEDDKSDD
ncbi:hypothetical protein SEA_GANTCHERGOBLIN_47 [Arthrobacter phage GantcherGoblin]|nr:hypothetical protein SEA_GANTCHERGOBLIN_47 [Arthrobacter phage GantcherGoblin]